VLRQLIALGHVFTEGEYMTLALADSARAVLKGEVQLLLRVPTVAPKRGRLTRGGKPGTGSSGKSSAPIELDDEGLERFELLKAWRAEVAKEHGLPAYVIFQNVTLAEMARQNPQSLDELAGISGVGAKKLEAYGEEILRVLG